MKSFSLALILALSCAPAGPILGPGPVEAFCWISAGNPDGGANATATISAPLGQSFVPCEDGIITNITAQVGGGSGPSHILGLQTGTDLLAPIYTQAGSILPGNSRIVFNPGFPVASGVVYSFSLTPVSGVLRLIQVDPLLYAGGTMLQVVEGVSVPRPADLLFSMVISDPPVPTSIVTWGQIKSTYR